MKLLILRQRGKKRKTLRTIIYLTTGFDVKFCNITKKKKINKKGAQFSNYCYIKFDFYKKIAFSIFQISAKKIFVPEGLENFAEETLKTRPILYAKIQRIKQK